MLKPGSSYTGTVKKIHYAVKTAPHSRAGHLLKYFHNVEVVVDRQKYILQVATDIADDAKCKVDEKIGFFVKNHHEPTNTFFSNLLPANVTPAMMEEALSMDGRQPVTGSLAERSLSLAIAYLQYQTDPSPDDLFSIADMMFGYMGNRLKIEGFI